MLKKHINQISLNTLLLSLIIITVAIIITIYTAFIYDNAKKNLFIDLQKQVQLIIGKSNQVIGKFIASYNVHEYEHSIVGEMGQKNILAIIIHDNNMAKILGQTSFVNGKIRDEAGEIVTYDTESENHQGLLEKNCYLVTHDIEYNGNLLGVMYVYATDRFINIQLYKIIQQVITSGVIVAFFLIAFLLISIRFIVIKPLYKMTQVITKVDEDGIPIHKVPVFGFSEINSFSITMNNMISILRRSRNKLQNHKENLEKVVKIRTLELTKEKQSAETANKTKSEFLANMSHEIRTPLNAINGFTELLIPLVNDKKQKKYLSSIKTAGKSLLALINDILDISKIEAGKMRIQYAPIDIQIILDEIKQIFGTSITGKALEFRMDIDNNIPRALFLDEIRLRQILLNIVGNAIKFTNNGYIKLIVKKIYLESDKSKLNLEISVKDTGIGIAKSDQEKIFELFEQQEGQSTRLYKGTGLGLSISKRLAEMMHGQIKVSSKINQGSTFTLMLRDVEIASANIPINEEQHIDVERIVFERAKILVVDDIRSNRELLHELFSLNNLEVLTAESGQEAILIAQEYLPDLIIMDIKMPVMDGVETTKHLKQNQKTKLIPIVALSASQNPEYVEQLYKLGIVKYLSKPITKSELIFEISNYLKHTKSMVSDNAGDAEIPIINQSLTNIENLPALIKILKKDIIPLCKKMENTGAMNEIKKFGSRIEKIGVEFSAQALIKYAEEINEYAQDYELHSIKTALKELPEQVNEMEKTIKRGCNGQQ